MFRDPPYFRALRETVVPMLRTYPSLKVWVAGCSTGEEAYSLAILLREEGLLERTLIYATDINPARAAEGRGRRLRARPHRRLHRELSAGRAALRRCPTTTPRPTAARVRQVAAQHIVFSDHSLATDSVFAEVQLVSCRNVLIYFNRALQDRAVGLFRDSLCRRGFLGSAPRRRCASPRTPTRSTEFVPRATASTRSGGGVKARRCRPRLASTRS